MKALLHKWLSWCPLYRIAAGGYLYYRHVEEGRHDPSEFRSCGQNIMIGDNVCIRAPENMKVGDGSKIADECFIDATGGLTIGKCSCLARGTCVLTTDHQANGDSLPFDDTRIVKPIIIEDCVWVGRNAAILPGVTIGEGAIIGLGAVVRQDIASCAIAVGNPARVIGYRDKDHYRRLRERDAIRPPGLSRRRYWIPEEVRQKHQSLLTEIGYECNGGSGYFQRQGRR